MRAMKTLDYDERKKELELLSYIDESAPYEIDENGIYYDRKAKKSERFVLLSASGCSCWDGDFEEETFPSLKAIEKFLIHDGNAQYHPSLEGAKQLIREAKAARRKAIKK